MSGKVFRKVEETAGVSEECCAGSEVAKFETLSKSKK